MYCLVVASIADCPFLSLLLNCWSPVSSLKEKALLVHKLFHSDSFIVKKVSKYKIRSFVGVLKIYNDYIYWIEMVITEKDITLASPLAQQFIAPSYSNLPLPNPLFVNSWMHCLLSDHITIGLYFHWKEENCISMEFCRIFVIKLQNIIILKFVK